MKKQISVIAGLISVFLLVPFVSAFGEVAGPIVFNVSAGSMQTQNWGVLNNESINVTITADGAAAQYISFQNVTLLPNNQITWIPVTATIPSGYSGSSNITGHLYALAQGQPGQVQINLRLEKAFYILIPSTQSNSQTINGVIANGQTTGGSASSGSSSSSSSTSSSSATQTSTSSATTTPISSTTSTAFPSLLTGLFALQPIYYVAAAILAVIIIAGLLFLVRNRHGTKNEDVDGNNESVDENNESVDENNTNL